MDIDLTTVVENAARDRWNTIAERLNAEIDNYPEELALGAVPMPPWHELEAKVQHIMRENELHHCKFLVPHIKEQVIGQVRLKIELNELKDPETGEWVAAGFISTEDLRELIGEPR